ncbi:MAG TPA: hypothetical protein VMG12_22335 [Polyangiaceae bacterium]|nr:hypothetical protein [Polyangiaceae bacterium]
MKTMRRAALAAGVLGTLGIGLLACGGAPARFPVSEPLWRDPDDAPFGPAPPEYVSPMVWDVGDQSVFYPLARVFALDRAGESVNVNALDEVPDSSWFQNRIGLHGMSPAATALGPCDPGAGGPASDGPPRPWLVTGAKPNGANPGFIIKDASGKRHLVKFDGLVQGPRATAADVVVSKLYHAAGYGVPCNRVVFFERDDVSISEGAKAETATGDEEPLTQQHLDAVFAKAQRLPDGRLRASTSLFLSGKPIGPFTYQGTLDADPNDVIPHQDRRELRGMRLLAAWTQHFDAREQNTLSMWIATGEDQGFVRHGIIDFGDCFGSIWEPPTLGRRLGFSHYFDLSETLSDWLTFGLRERPWDSARFGRSGKVFGYYAVENFEAEDWKAGYPNPAFSRMSERDGAWMARIIAQFSDAHLRELVSVARLEDAGLDAELFRLLGGRRDRVLERYLTRLSPLASPTLRRGGDELCLHDVLAQSGIRRGHGRSYAVTLHSGEASQRIEPVRSLPGDRVCVSLPRASGATALAPAYLIVDWVSASDGFTPEFPARLHLVDQGPRGFAVVGLERPESFDPPT